MDFYCQCDIIMSFSQEEQSINQILGEGKLQSDTS